MVKSAFEFLFGIGTDVNEFVRALTAVLPPGGARDGPMAARWRNARPKAARPMEAWAREFCALRGGAAHGKKRGGDQFVWSEHAHLAFTSILFPLVVKCQLSKLGCLRLDERDVIELELSEAYLMHDPFEPAGKGRRLQAHEHPWNHVYSDGVLGEVLRRQIARIVDEVGKGDPPARE
jgi:hypothetical protein